MKKILVVEDENSIREMVALNLKMAGYEVCDVATAERAQELYGSCEDFTLALLDVMLPGMSGFSLCEKLRAQNNTIGIMILSAKGMEGDKVRGLSIGADDYMTKPFSVTELLARLEALARRVQRTNGTAVPAALQDADKLTAGSFTLDKKSRILYKKDEPVELTQVEFQIMELFLQNPGVALQREKIMEGVWGANYFGDVKIVDVNIRRLRMKVEDDPGTPEHILTVWGFGYRWNA